MMTREPGTSCVIWRVASRPLSCGIAMSMTMTCGCSFLASWRAWRPVSASPSTSMSDSTASSERRPWRTTVWSSARSTVILGMAGGGLGLMFGISREGQVGGTLNNLKRDGGTEAGAAPGGGVDGEFPAHEAHPLAEPHETQLAGNGLGRLGAGDEALAVVAELEAHVVLRAGDDDVDLPGLGVLGDVGEPLLDDAVEDNFALRVELLGVLGLGGVEAHGEAGALAEALHVVAQRRQQTQVIEHRRPELARELVDVAHRLLDQVLGFAEAARGVRRDRLEGGAEDGEIHVDGGQRLADLVVQVAADALAFVFLDLEHAVRHAAQVLLHLVGLVEEIAVVLLTADHGGLADLAARDVAAGGDDEVLRRQRGGVPEDPALGAVAGQVARLEGGDLLAA